tara:strand:+ start:202 stop:393 length:192 start_codon:yes stop_codon:yes gene_type:complete
MAKSTKKQKSMEETLWDSPNRLRGTLTSSEDKHLVIGLIFLKFTIAILNNNIYCLRKIKIIHH